MFRLPCVVTDVGPTHEFAGDGSAVKLVPHADPRCCSRTQFVDLIPDENARTKLSMAGRAWAETQYHPVSSLLRVYAELLHLNLAPLEIPD